MEQPMDQTTQEQSLLLDQTPLTQQDLKFVEEIVKHGNQTKAAKIAYDLDNDEYASKKGSESVRKSNIALAIRVKQTNLKQALLDKGITATKIAKKVDELLEAETPIYKNNNATKSIELVGYAPDYNAIDKGLKHATNIFGVVDPEKPKTGNTYNFFFNPELRKKVSDVEAEIKEALFNATET